MDVLIRHPYVGSIWLSHCAIIQDADGREYVEGDAWDDYMAGSPYYPDDYRGEWTPMNFPATCIAKRVDGCLSPN